MKEETRMKQSAWPKQVVRKWLNMKCDEFHSDNSIRSRVEQSQKRRNSGSDVVVPEHLSGWWREANDEFQQPRSTAANNLRMFVGTWNVAGRSPSEGFSLDDWLHSSTCAPADIYVLGFQEIVPLNAGNVLGAEDREPAAKWLSLIRKTLSDTNRRTTPQLAHYCDYAPSVDDGDSKPKLSFSDLLSLEDELDDESFDSFLSSGAASNSSDEGSPEFSPPARRRGRYCLAASKQMVGLFLCVWVRADLNRHIKNLKVSCVGRGIMGYLGNKGSISISMTLHKTTFCFVCTHLTSGEKEGDEVRRNSDVTEILKRTRFRNPCEQPPGDPVSPDSIMEHDKVIWLGDLNYRLTSYCSETNELLMKNDWQALLMKDQLKLEQRAGRVFEGWEEGKILFAPTYKYVMNSDYYVVHTSKSKSRRRMPAWCDRVLWRGEGLKQLCYTRGESRFSDHRPVSSLFSVQVNHRPS